MELNLIGVAYGNGAGDPGCADGPRQLAESAYLKELEPSYRWIATHHSSSTARGLEAMQAISALNLAVAKDVLASCQQRQPFVTIGGDQTCSLGTWSGARAALNGDLGLIWIDAHMDAHSPETTPSGNIHGMPLAALLGIGEPSMTHICNSEVKLKPENIVLIGIRSYEPEEQAHLEALGVRIYYMPEVESLGIEQVLAQAFQQVTANTQAYGVTIDLDGIDPSEAPAVGTPEDHGIAAAPLCRALSALNTDRLLGAEIVEFNPHKDINHKTERLIIQLLNALFSNKDVT